MAANRVKTVEYMLPNVLTQVTQAAAAGTYTDSADTTIYIPETTSRTILSARLEVTTYNYLYANSSNTSGWGVRCSCDGGTTWTTAVIANALNESDENYTSLMVVDVTAEFTARYTGTSDTCRWGYYIYGTASTTGWSNANAKLILTYEYDDTAHSTRIKTVRIPIESINARLTTSYAEICQGTAVNQIPQLTGAGSPFLPEASPTVRQAYLELWGNTIPNSTTDGALTLRLDSSGTTYAFNTYDNTQDSSSTIRVMWDITAEDLTTAHALYAVVTGTTMVGFLGGWLTVTYEYDHSSSTTILNSLVLGLGEDSNNVLASGDKSVVSVDRLIEEPGTLSLKQSGIWITYQSGNTSDTFTFKAGSQATTGYTPTADGSMCGMSSIVQRIDSGGNQGAALSLARGMNTFSAEWYTGTANRIGNVSCLMFLNYTSDKASSGDGVHAHSCYFPIFASNRAIGTTVQSAATVDPKIIESNYWLMGVVPMIYIRGIGAVVDGQVLDIERLSGEGNGWLTLFSSLYTGVGENGCWINNGVCRFAFKRWPNDTDTERVDIEGSRQWRIYGTSKQYGLGVWITWHSHTYTIAGTVTGYADADGAGLTVGVHRSDTGELVGTATTTAGGAYTFTWYDNVIDMYAEIREDATHMGRSDDDIAS